MRKTAILAALQVGAILAWAGYHERVRATAPTFRVPLAPRDPYDVLRGRYFILNPRDRFFNTEDTDTYLTTAAVDTFLRGERSFHGYAFAGFCPVGEVFRVCVLQRLEEGAPRDGFWARALVQVNDGTSVLRPGETVRRQLGWRMQVDLGLDRFFLPDSFVLPADENDPTWQLEVSHRPGLPLLPKRLWVRGQPVNIGD